jgi:hypothetical protein
MEKRGWLRSHAVEDSDDIAFAWTPAGETALEMSGLVRKRAAETN